MKTTIGIAMCICAGVVSTAGIARAECDPSADGPVAAVSNGVHGAWSAVAADAISGAALSPAAQANARKMRNDLLSRAFNWTALHGSLAGFTFDRTLSKEGGELSGAMAFRSEVGKFWPGQEVSVGTESDAPIAGDTVTVSGPKAASATTNIVRPASAAKVYPGATNAPDLKTDLTNEIAKALAANHGVLPKLELKRQINADPAGLESVMFDMAAALRAKYPGRTIGVGTPGDEAPKVGDVISLDIE